MLPAVMPVALGPQCRGDGTGILPKNVWHLLRHHDDGAQSSRYLACMLAAWGSALFLTMQPAWGFARRAANVVPCGLGVNVRFDYTCAVSSKHCIALLPSFQLANPLRYLLTHCLVCTL